MPNAHLAPARLSVTERVYDVLSAVQLLREYAFPAGLLAMSFHTARFASERAAGPTLAAPAAALATNVALAAAQWLFMRRAAAHAQSIAADHPAVAAAAELAARCGVTVLGTIRPPQGQHGQWYATGARRGYLAINVDLPADVLRATIAHELGHARGAHVQLVLIGRWGLGAVQIAAMVLLAPLPGLAALVVVGIAGAAALAALFRACERVADGTAVVLAGRERFVAAAERFSSAEIFPGPLERALSSHPSWAERIDRFAS